ncbi:predicted protein [Histoplasma capsulatum G186AR]|uniref:Uncharacterized protein n=1 Tax=Ajellomyces capsulatus (strain G186AR / H82 / ATCC MYA-2454 / RMSCC 2432) TaxID=447093 RepID=C0NBJ9_AJECG|nr:uncharacterized protein HCBG_00495 [Histoplasma capsulatum G186AR]EEH11040.1 predicted protein [Histoplasma capsulatum G186AR]
MGSSMKEHLHRSYPPRKPTSILASPPSLARIFRLRVTLFGGLLHNPKAAVVWQEHRFQMSIELRLLRRVSTRFSPARILEAEMPAMPRAFDTSAICVSSLKVVKSAISSTLLQYEGCTETGSLALTMQKLTTEYHCLEPKFRHERLRQYPFRKF